ncbi:Hypothetical protein I595_3186 [Croceitalea dokdonensis DOKDO 023]|uniref:Uncharacterized protein n=1 Tax=Croceitalea dokdonensis DOKDO 023 TaxID=1300341 RepID=A0A0P7ARZ4_9FLAO|nr:DUF6090 family protein [Croceitalea dokdonensis]KPM30690.1 Hypothetical protein I595_3186 [Croceitalea dokdonensis DOKDO 023]
MIKFFRKIRQNLLSEGKTGKYFKYAIGEIILVVIGILIALQVNDWNQNQKNRELSKLYVENFIKSVESDIVFLSDRIKINEKQIQNIASIINTLSTQKNLSESELTSFFEQNYSLGFESYFIPELSTFRQFESNNAGVLIENKKLADKLYEYYLLNERNEKNGEISTQLYQHNYVTKNLIKHLTTGDFLETKIGSSLNRPKLDLETLRQDYDYIGTLLMKNQMTESQNERYQGIKEKAENLLQLLESE